MMRALYDCSAVLLTPAGPEVRLVVATHAVTASPPPIGVERDGTIYELFISTLPSPSFTASDVLDLYLHRGSFETVLADEDNEQESARWYSHAPCGQEFAQILAQWVWNLRLELGQTLSPSELRTTKFAPARATEPVHACEPVESVEGEALGRRSSRQTNPGDNVWTSSMGPSLLYSWLSRLRVYSATGWDAALPCQPSAVSTGTASRA